MFLMCADPLWGQVRGGWALEIKFFGAWNKWQREKRVPLGPKKVLEIVPKRIFFSVHCTCQIQLSEQYSGSQLAFGTIFWVLGSYLKPGTTFQEGFRKNFSKLVRFFEPNINFIFIFYLSQKGHRNIQKVLMWFLRPSRKHSSHDTVSLRPNKGNRRRDRTGRSWTSHASWVSGWYRPFTGQCCLIYTKYSCSTYAQLHSHPLQLHQPTQTAR